MRETPPVVTVQTAMARPRSSNAIFGHPIISASPLPIVTGSGGWGVIGIHCRAVTSHGPDGGFSSHAAMLEPLTFVDVDGQVTSLPAQLIELPCPAVPTPTK